MFCVSGLILLQYITYIMDIWDNSFSALLFFAKFMLYHSAHNLCHVVKTFIFIDVIKFASVNIILLTFIFGLWCVPSISYATRFKIAFCLVNLISFTKFFTFSIFIYNCLVKLKMYAYFALAMRWQMASLSS